MQLIISVQRKICAIPNFLCSERHTMTQGRQLRARATFISAVALAMCSSALSQYYKDDELPHFDITLPETNVPDELTTYVCYTQKIPVADNGVFYATSFDPIIVNTDVMHHMIMFGCEGAPPSTKSFSPHVCSGEDNRCRSFVVQWSKGIKGPIRSPPNTGVKFGRGSFMYFSLQIHWNNAKFVNGTTDASGMRVYYTKEPREFPLGNVQVGQNDLEIPAKEGRLAQTGSCSSECTSRWLKEPIYLTRVHIHMHYLGAGGVLELLRGLETFPLVYDKTYDYNKPPAHRFLEPVKVLPGDELRLTCFFNNRDGDHVSNETVYWGEGSDGEMCYAFITYYPRVEQFDQCIQFDEYDICSGSGLSALGECIFPGFVHSVDSGMAQDIIENCIEGPKSNSSNVNPTNVETRQTRSKGGISDYVCRESCDIAVRELIEHPCMQGRLGLYARRVYLPDTLNWFIVKDILDQWERQCSD